MKKISMSLLVAGLIMSANTSFANDFKTVTRVHFVQDCVAANQSKMNVYEATQKCSCVIDKLADVFTESEFEDMETGFRYRNLPGDRGGEFKDDADVNDGIALFKKTNAQAYKDCRMR